MTGRWKSLIERLPICLSALSLACSVLSICLRTSWSVLEGVKGSHTTAGSVHGQPPYQNKRPIFGPIFDFLFCRFRLTRNVKGFLLGGRELSPNRPEKCQISSEMSANSQQMVPSRPDRRGGRKGSRNTRSLDTRRKRRSGELHVYVESTDPVGDRQDDRR